MTDSDLLVVYRDYLACLNARRWDELGRFVAEGVIYNGKRLGLNGYRSMLEANTYAIPDLQFTPEILLANDNVVAARLFFECTPERVFVGFEPTGSRIGFAEHVFYRIDNRRIVEVWSVIDKQAVHDQMSRES